MNLLLVIPICLVLGLSYPLFRKKVALWQWRKRLNIAQHEALFNQLYNNVNGFVISKEARRHKDSLEFVYGEIEFESFIALLSLCRPTKQTIFYDLGSGTGKAVIAGALVFPMQKSCGVELLTPLHQCALKQKERLLALNSHYLKTTAIEFKDANFLEEDLQEANLLFINATSFLGEYWQAISHKLEQLKPGSLVISTSKKIKSPLFVSIYSTSLHMSWGITAAFIQQKI